MTSKGASQTTRWKAGNVGSGIKADEKVTAMLARVCMEQPEWRSGGGKTGEDQSETGKSPRPSTQQSFKKPAEKPTKLARY